MSVLHLFQKQYDWTAEFWEWNPRSVVQGCLFGVLFPSKQLEWNRKSHLRKKTFFCGTLKTDTWRYSFFPTLWQWRHLNLLREAPDEKLSCENNMYPFREIHMGFIGISIDLSSKGKESINMSMSNSRKPYVCFLSLWLFSKLLKSTIQ